MGEPEVLNVAEAAAVKAQFSQGEEPKANLAPKLINGEVIFVRDTEDLEGLGGKSGSLAVKGYVLMKRRWTHDGKDGFAVWAEEDDPSVAK